MTREQTPVLTFDNSLNAVFNNSLHSGFPINLWSLIYLMGEITLKKFQPSNFVSTQHRKWLLVNELSQIEKISVIQGVLMLIPTTKLSQKENKICWFIEFSYLYE